jgi:hypothetical protein
MAISKKGRRKIICNEKEYIWYVQMDEDSPYYCLNIASGDRRILLSCPLGVKTNYVICKGKEFQGKKKTGTWKRYITPVKIPEIITPKIVADIIIWAEEDGNAIAVEYDGVDIVL